MNYRKPQELKVLTGTFRGDRDEADVRAVSDLPDKLPAPSHIGSFGKKQWRKLTGLLEKDGLLKNIDLGTLEACCMAYDDMIQASYDMNKYQKKLKEAEEDLRDAWEQDHIKSQAEKIKSYLSLVERSRAKKNKAMLLFHKFMNEFGLSPGSRKRLAITEKKSEESEFEKMLARKKSGIA